MNSLADIAKSPDVQFAMKSLNTLYSMRRKLRRVSDGDALARSISVLEQLFREEWCNQSIGFSAHDPTGEVYSETRSDCDASIAGESAEHLVIVETLKPILHLLDKSTQPERSFVIQKGSVVVRSKDELEQHHG